MKVRIQLMIDEELLKHANKEADKYMYNNRNSRSEYINQLIRKDMGESECKKSGKT